jgi:tripartite-type tricarboxylate transporter receptor subunit TctC
MRKSVAAMLMLAACVPATAQSPAPDAKDYPNRAIHIVVPFPAGGPADVAARLLAQRMNEDWGQPVIVDNRPGGNTVIAAQLVAKAAPDGYTLLMAIDSTLVMNQFLYKSLPYDPINDFAPITTTTKTVSVLAVLAQNGPTSVQDLVAKAKAAPGKLNYGAGTITTKLTGHLFNKAAGVDTMLVPYNGSAEVAQALLTKSVDFSFDGPSASLSLINSGQFRVLAKFDPRPFPPVPNLPLVTAEVPKLDEITVWLGLVAPKGTPAPIAEALSRQVAKILADPAVKAKADASGLYPATSTPAEFSAFIRKEAERWGPVVKETGMRFD